MTSTTAKDGILVDGSMEQPHIATNSGDFQLSKTGGGDACRYDLRDHQEPPNLTKEYPNYNGEEEDKKDIKEGIQSK